jgi:hypothetical protein
MIMKDPVDKYIAAYKEQFNKEMKNRHAVRSEENEFLNLGQNVIDKGFGKLVSKIAPDFSIDALDKDNAKLSKKLNAKVNKATEKMRDMPDLASRISTRNMRMMQEVAIPHHHSGCIPYPPLTILTDADGPTEGSNLCEVTTNVALGRIYPHINVFGTGRSGLRDSEVICDYLWSFIPDRSEGHYVTAHVEIHGFEVITLEHHCFHDSEATREIELLMDVSQSGPLSPEPISGPQNLGHGRIDTWRWPIHTSAFLEAGRRAWVVVRVRVKASARCRYARSEMNFGNPTDSNYIGMPWLCWQGVSEF